MSERLFQKAGSHSVLIQSPAKVNLRLEVLSKRPDGYHEVRTVMVPIDLHDTLHIALTENDGIEVSCSRAEVPVDDRNLAYRAGLRILEKTRKRKGIEIRIEKRIPVEAGLGGGSSNAASTLLGLNRLLGTGLSRGELMAMAKELGADVPFFVLGRPALATGIGETLQELAELPSFSFLLVYPGIRISTRWAYERLNLWLTNPREHINIPAFSWDISNLDLFLRNDLENVVIGKYPVLRSIKETLLTLGAAGSLMSGSGSTVFGVFLAWQEAEQAYEKLKKEFEGREWEVFLVRSCGH